MKNKTKRRLIYLAGSIILIILLFIIFNVGISLIGFLILLLKIIETPKSFIASGIIIIGSIYWMRIIAKRYKK